MGKYRNDDPSSWFPDERAAVPPAVEDASDAAWAEWQACSTAMESRLSQLKLASARQTQQVLHRASQARSAEAFLATELQPHAVPQPTLVPAPALDACTVMRLAREGDRICPLPAVWRRLYGLLPAVHDGDVVLRAPLPLDSIEWPRATDFFRQRRLRDQVDWAAEHGGLAQVHAFLSQLPEGDWHHLGELRWPTLV
ncbi:hypothetical protein [Ramlibacter humi]|uniref:Uncharacterized protein n=1 Tax=Ramlibacter humi TaxID=2530451 RepID=A0A4Z0BE90_9BURK|nr:hypothetical protein [Ramlibacter humi]TFY96699.1 hypothetical protein EZ216_20165 [Ramlibacter humi]